MPQRARLATSVALAIAIAVTVGCMPPGASERGGPARGAEPTVGRRDAGRPLRVVTFNLLHGGPWSEWTGDDQGLERRLEMVASELAALDPDIVALQEASVGRRRGHVAERLAQRLGLEHVHAAATDHVFGSRLLGRAILSVIGFREGPAILSRLPIVASEVVELPRCRRWWDPRVLLSATLRTPLGDLLVYSTHTSRDDCQLDRVRDVVRARRNGLPSLVMGDLNTSETMPALTAFGEAGFLDAFRSANVGADGATVWQRVKAPVSTTSRRVDYILLLPGDTVRGRVTASRVVLKTPGRDADGATLWPSDHHGVLAEVSLAAPRAAR
jgi:endonuclease/exonuclease/phosphatase family metal-dependent hydrolase